jgi:hypothetical protein
MTSEFHSLGAETMQAMGTNITSTASEPDSCTAAN